MTAGGNYGDDDDDFGGGRRERDRGPRRGGRREFSDDVPDYGGPPPDLGGGYGEGDRGGNRGGGGYRGGGGGGYRGDRDHGGGGYRGGDQGGGYRGGDQGGGGGGYRGGDHGGGGGGYRGGGGRPHHQDREPKEPGPRQNGVLKFFNTDRGFGFITPDDGHKDVFVHISAIERSGLPPLAEGTRVSFETEEDRRGRGFQAVNLQLLGD